MTRNPIPSFARNFPDIAMDLAQTRLPFYCANCQRKRETTYLTPDFGPFCDECLDEASKVALVRRLTEMK